MSDFDTVKSVNKNLLTVLSGQGLKFTMLNSENLTSKVGKGEAGILEFIDTVYENTHGQRMSWAEANYNVMIVTGIGDKKLDRDKQERLQQWIFKIRNSLTVNGLNIGDLSSSQLVSLVTSGDNEIIETETQSTLIYPIAIRYREL